jgi:carboxymethylenebutenolidase
MDGYWAKPKSGHGPTLLILPAWWGLNSFFKGLCDRLAGEGFIAFAPDLYQGKIASTMEEAKALRSKLNQKQAFSELLRTVDELYLLDGISKPIGVIGFSMGARFGLELSAEKTKEISAVVTFYSASNVDYSSSNAAYLGHFAEKDEWVAASGVKKLERTLKSAGRPVSFYTYPGTGHWFFETDRPDVYAESSAQIAWERTIDFLHLHLDN